MATPLPQLRAREAMALARLSSRGYALSVLGFMRARGGARLAELLAATGAARGTLIETLRELMRLGLLHRARGRGHPLRPEYLLTEEGAILALPAATLIKAAQRAGQPSTLLQAKWSLPVIHLLGGETLRFNEIKGALSAVTPRAVSLALKDLSAAGYVGREVASDSPPAFAYHLMRRAAPLKPPLDALAAEALQIQRG